MTARAPEGGAANLAALLWPFGLRIQASSYLPRGTIAYTRGCEVIGWTTAERAKFLGLFGFVETCKSCDGLILPTEDFEALALDLGRSRLTAPGAGDAPAGTGRAR